MGALDECQSLWESIRAGQNKRLHCDGVKYISEIHRNNWSFDSMVKERTSSKRTSKPGPKPQLLKIKGNWERAVTKSFKKKKPPEGWPK